jgi:hypothetical protein
VEGRQENRCSRGRTRSVFAIRRDRPTASLAPCRLGRSGYRNTETTVRGAERLEAAAYDAEDGPVCMGRGEVAPNPLQANPAEASRCLRDGL